MSRRVLVVVLFVAVVSSARQVGAEDSNLPVVADLRELQGRLIERIRLHGNTKIRAKVIRREMTVAEGDPFDARDLETARRRIIALGELEWVDIKATRGSSDALIVLDVVIVERLSTVPSGVGFSSLESFIAEVRMSQSPLAFCRYYRRPSAATLRSDPAWTPCVGPVHPRSRRIHEDHPIAPSGWSRPRLVAGSCLRRQARQQQPSARAVRDHRGRVDHRSILLPTRRSMVGGSWRMPSRDHALSREGRPRW